MTTVFRSRTRAEEFAARVDGTTPEGTRTNPATERLVGVTQLLRAQAGTDPDSRPREEFTLDLRERLMAEAAQVLTPQNTGLALPARTRGKRERRLVAVASATVLLGGTAGMATAAQSALPGEALYPVKRAIEQAEAGLSTSSAGRGRDYLHQATDRLTEAQGLIDRGTATSAPQVPLTLESFTGQARHGADLLLASYQDSRDPDAIRAVREFAASGLRTVEVMNGTAPAEARPGLRDAALVLRDIDASARRLCATCADLPALSLPKVFLASAEVDRAMRQLDVAGLDNSHPVIADKQALRRAGAVAGSGPTASKPRSKPGTGGAALDLTPEQLAPEVPKATRAPLPSLSGVAPTPEVKVSASLDPGKLGAGLGDAVETLLPDPGTVPTPGTGLLP